MSVAFQELETNRFVNRKYDVLVILSTLLPENEITTTFI